MTAALLCTSPSSTASPSARLLVRGGRRVFITLEGSSALHVAVSTAAIPHFLDASAEAVAMLLENDAEALATDDYGRSALHLAAGFGLDKIVALLLDKYRRRALARVTKTRPIPSARAISTDGHLFITRASADTLRLRNRSSRGVPSRRSRTKSGKRLSMPPSSAATRRPSRQRCSRRMLHWPARRATTGKPRSIWRRRGGTP